MDTDAGRCEYPAQQAGKICAPTSLPVAAGFGLSNPEPAGLVASSSDAVVVGSAVVNQIAQHGRSPELLKRVGAFVKSLVAALKVFMNQDPIS
jgi:tryptophan synthase alpha chain